jgi:hypothetical protein
MFQTMWRGLCRWPGSWPGFLIMWMGLCRWPGCCTDLALGLPSVKYNLCNEIFYIIFIHIHIQEICFYAERRISIDNGQI